MTGYKVGTEFNHDIVNIHQLENWRTKRHTLNPYHIPGETEDVKAQDAEIEDSDNLDKSYGQLHKCSRKPCISQFIRSERLDSHLQTGICKIYKPKTVETINERVTTMYISAFGSSFYEKYNTKQKEARSMMLHLGIIDTLHKHL